MPTTGKNSPWQDVNVKEALKDIRPPSDITLICCDHCGRYSYYNQGSHFTCRFSNCGRFETGESLDMILDSGAVCTLEEWTEAEMNY